MHSLCQSQARLFLTVGSSATPHPLLYTIICKLQYPHQINTLQLYFIFVYTCMQWKRHLRIISSSKHIRICNLKSKSLFSLTSQDNNGWRCDPNLSLSLKMVELTNFSVIVNFLLDCRFAKRFYNFCLFVWSANWGKFVSYRKKAPFTIIYFTSQCDKNSDKKIKRINVNAVPWSPLHYVAARMLHCPGRLGCEMSTYNVSIVW